MPCYKPLQANYSVRPDGKKSIRFSNVQAQLFEFGHKFCKEFSFSIPCGKCMGCRLERSRQMAVRCMHEAQMNYYNCFLTLTYSEKNLPKDGSLNKKHVQDFLKRLRFKYSDKTIRVYYCGEYGERLSRPHYHVILFNHDFSDKKFFKKQLGCNYYVSDELEKLWTHGHCIIGDLTFESAAYVARYCTKKITGKDAEKHYGGRLPEFAQGSLKPGIGKTWLDKYGFSDVFSHDEVVMRGVKCKPPRYYDKQLEKMDPERFQVCKERRMLLAEDREDDATYARLVVREKCHEARFRKLIRSFEKDRSSICV